MITFIKWCLEKKEERLRYPESYSSAQMETAEKILQTFEDINIIDEGQSALEVQLGNDSNTVIVMPIKKSKIGLIANIPNTHKTKWGDNEDSLIIKPKRKFRKQFPQTLIIRRIHKVSS